jgi:hypothetical protein
VDYYFLIFIFAFRNLKPTVKFIIEQERVQTLPFLDVLVKRSDRIIETNVYRKPMDSTYTTTPVTLSTKRGIIKCLSNTAKVTCTERQFKRGTRNSKGHINMKWVPTKIHTSSPQQQPKTELKL